MYDGDGSPITAEGLKRIARLYEIEEAIRGQSAGQRKPTGQAKIKPLMADYEIWLKIVCSRISAKSRLGQKFDYIGQIHGGSKTVP